MNPLLEFGSIYTWFQNAIGSAGVRRYFVENYVNLQSGRKVLDIGCGPGNMIPFLPPTEYFGLDENANYITKARKHFGTRGKFFCQRISDPLPEEVSGVDVAIGFGVLHHLNDEECSRFFLLASQALKTGGRLVTLDGCFRVGQHPIARLMNHLDRGKFVRTTAQYVELASRTFSEVQCFDYCGKLRIPISHCVLACRKLPTIA